MQAGRILALLVALGAGLLAFSYLTFDAAEEPGPGAGGAARTSSDTGELAALQGAVADLGARLERLEQASAAALAPPAAAPAVSQRVPVAGVSPEELQELRELVQALKHPEQGTQLPFEELVLGVIEAREGREREEREQARLDAAAERMQQRVAELAEELGLSSFQSGEMLSILTKEQFERDSFFLEMREGGGFDRDAIREGLEGLRASTLMALGRVLSPDQYDLYVKSSANSFFGGPRGGPDGPTPGGPDLDPGGRGGR